VIQIESIGRGATVEIFYHGGFHRSRTVAQKPQNRRKFNWSVRQSVQGRSQELKLGAVLAVGQGRGRRSRARRAAPRGRGLGRVALPSFGGPGVLPPENFSDLSSKSVHFNAYLRSYVVSRSVFFQFF
jgi:hypothetical protein